MGGIDTSTGARWRAASDLLDQTLELPEERRREVLERACAGRPELRRDVEALLAADAEAGALDRPVAEYAASLLASAAPPLAGRRLSHFLVKERIGAGGMGVVHRALDERLQRDVALKFLPEADVEDPELRERLLREARAASALNHPGIVTVYEVGAADGVDFIAMELVDGQPLSSLVPKGGLPVPTVVSYASQVAGAVAIAHERGILHRDLKPGNLLVTADGRVKVLDFGLAKPMDELEPAVPGPSPSRSPAGTIALTGAGAVVGTPAYMSPEQAEGRPLDARSDVFSLGAILYEMLVGESPFRRRNAAASMAAIRNEEPPPLREARPDVPVPVAALVTRCLSKDPAKRPPTMRDVLFELAAVERGLSRPGRRRAMIAAAVVAGLVASGTWAVARRAGRAPAPLSFDLLSTFPGSHRQPSLSPDGRSIAFVAADGTGVPQIWVKPLADGAPRRLTDEPTGVGRPRWSPRKVIVYAVKGKGIWAIPEEGGPARRLVSSGVEPNVSRDGTRLVFQRRTRLLVAREDGSDEREVPGVGLHFPFGGAYPAFSPDGREVAYFQDAEVPTAGELCVAPIDGGRVRCLTGDGAFVTDPVFTPDGKRILFSSSRLGPLTLWEVEAGGGEPRAVTSGSGEDSETDVSDDGKRLVYVNRRTTYTLSGLDPSTGARRVIAERRFAVTHPSFSPDGARLTYFTNEGKAFHVFVAEASGAAERALDLGSLHADVLPEFSADGRSIYLFRIRPDALFVRYDLGTSRLVTVATDFPNERHLGAHVDPWGRRLVFPVLEDGVCKRTVVRELPGGEERSLAEPLYWPRFSPDGREVTGGASDRSLKSCPPTGEACRVVSPRGQHPVWALGWIYFVRYGDVLGDADVTNVEVRRVRPDGTGEEHVADLPGAHPVQFFYTVSPSSGEIVWSEYRPGTSEIWTAELPGRR